MRSRKEAVTFFIRAFFDHKPIIPLKEGGFTYGVPERWGRCEIRRLMDFIYEGPPQSPGEEI